jgi:hypothetical protein
LLGGVGGNFTFTWGLANPDHWIVQYSIDGTTGWVFDQTLVAATRAFNGLHFGGDYRVGGFDLSGKMVTDWSNSVSTS